ncbi:hypothetical protein K2173_002808 [Erythroxylum novogranatense]|uniref:Uncharacterized protein n=1 Tax=Erythroxylum novogranatense TaxID=1862640 RepID=A0AAV8SPY0_9ROSI|nr:hypothetical protein K2173_002808 [Erythroxylum novogranatense]
MAEPPSEVESHDQEVSFSRTNEDEDEKDMPTPDFHDVALKIERASEVYRGYSEVVDNPSRPEIWIWFFYEFCSYFIHTVLLPVLFPLHISPIKRLAKQTARYGRGLMCTTSEIQLYEALTQRSIPVGKSKFSPLEWTSFSWAIGLFLAAIVIASLSTHFDHGQKHAVISGAAIAIGTFFCLPTGFFNVTWIFPPYIAAIVTAYIITTAGHTRHLGVMVRGFTGPTIQKNQFHFRRRISNWLSLHATAAGSFGSAIISAFVYHMLEKNEKFLSFWVVSIFSGIIWILGIPHIFFFKPGPTTLFPVSPVAHFLSIFNFPHAYANLLVAFLASFTAMNIFTTVVLYLIGQLCLKPVFVLFLWLTYFIFPLVAMPLVQPLQLLIKSNGVKMYLLGFYLSTLTSGFAFYFRGKIWERHHIMTFAGLQSTSVGLLYAFGRVVLLDCTPHGKEGVFSAWLSWIRSFGTCAGFTVAAAMPKNTGTCLAISFWSAVAGGLFLIYSNISDTGGARRAWNLIEEGDEFGSPVQGLDNTTAEPSKKTNHEGAQ